MTYSRDAYTCAHCQQVVIHTTRTSSYSSGRSIPIHSDGYSRLVGWWRFIKCPLCQNTQRSTDLTLIDDPYFYWWVQYPDYSEEDEGGYINPHQTRGLTLADYGQLLVNLPHPLTQDDELYIRNRIRWLFNDFFHSYNQNGGIGYWTLDNKYAARRIRLPKTCEIGNAFWKENLERIVALNNGESVEERLSKADALRSLGNFRQALQVLESITKTVDDLEPQTLSQTIRVFCHQLIHACKRKNRRPFLVIMT